MRLASQSDVFCHELIDNKHALLVWLDGWKDRGQFCCNTDLNPFLVLQHSSITFSKVEKQKTLAVLMTIIGLTVGRKTGRDAKLTIQQDPHQTSAISQCVSSWMLRAKQNRMKKTYNS